MVHHFWLSLLRLKNEQVRCIKNVKNFEESKMEVSIVMFQGVPSKAFANEEDLIVYLNKNGTSLAKIADEQNNPTPNWEVYKLVVE